MPSKPTITRINRTVISYCDIPEKIRQSNTAINEASCDVYVSYNVTPQNKQADFDDDFDLDNWIIKNWPELEGRTILIHIDY